MFKRRKPESTASETSAPATPPLSTPSQAQARALLSMLETGAKQPDRTIPPDQLRDLARDLIAKVEAQTGAKADAATTPPSDQSPSVQQSGRKASRPTPLLLKAEQLQTPGLAADVPPPPTREPRIFRSIEPFDPHTPLIRKNRQADVAEPVDRLPGLDELPRPISGAQHRGAVSRATVIPKPRWCRDRTTVKKLVTSAFATQDGAIEHPAILALELVGRPPREQAVRLRAQPSGHIHAAHRYLNVFERDMD